MSNNRTTEQTATERLRSLLDERGVEYETADAWWTSWDTAGASDIGAVVYCEDLGSGLEIRWHTITPEQAVAATLGSGTLTAEQVEKAIRDCSTYASYDGCTYYASGIRLQAIADELNARAERTCECVAEYAKSPFDGKTMVLHRCSKCHELMRPHMLYCPNCGARVVA